METAGMSEPNGESVNQPTGHAPSVTLTSEDTTTASRVVGGAVPTTVIFAGEELTLSIAGKAFVVVRAAYRDHADVAAAPALRDAPAPRETPLPVSEGPTPSVTADEVHEAVMRFYDGNHLMEEDVIAHEKMRKALANFLNGRSLSAGRVDEDAPAAERAIDLMAALQDSLAKEDLRRMNYLVNESMTDPNALFRRNTRITREAIDAARATAPASETTP